MVAGPVLIALALASTLIVATADNGDDGQTGLGTIVTGNLSSTGAQIQTYGVNGASGSGADQGADLGKAATRPAPPKPIVPPSRVITTSDCDPDPTVPVPDGQTAFCVRAPDGTEQTWVVPEEETPMTWADIANFKAQTGTVTTEPAHVILVGMETNFVSSARQHVVAGTLRGDAARVRFTPVAWTWDYGDGTSRTTTTPGATWAQLGVDDFTATATSHTYAGGGDYTIRTAVTLRAEYSIGDDAWTPIAGTLTLPTDTLRMTAYTASTVLVAQDCDENPTGPGCG